MNTQTSIKRLAVSIVAVALLFGMTGTMQAQDTSEKVQELIDRTVEAQGGRDAFDAIENIYTEAQLKMPAMGLTMDLKIWLTEDDQMLTITGSEATGEIRRGWNGDVFWESSMMTGPRLIEGAELDQAIRELAFNKYIDWKEYFETAEYAGEDTLDGEVCDLIKFTPAEGHASTIFVSRESSMTVAEKSTIEHQMGEIPVMAKLSDFREVNGMKMPFKTTMEVMGQSRSIEMSKIETNIEMPDSLFVVPEEIKELMASDTTDTE